jgi:GDP-4-dehydro-6-deoxy-D-mannose reductase
LRAFITGITGFAGTHLAEHLLAGGDSVAGCSRSGRWQAERLPDTPEAIELLAWDIAADIPGAVRSRVAAIQPDCVFHLAAVSVPRECGQHDPTGRAWAVNVQGTRRVLDLAASLPNTPRVILVSSSHVYATPPVEDLVVDEDAPCEPVGAYGRTKLAAEGELLRAVAVNSIDGIVARTFLHAGPRQDPRLMLSHWCRQMVDDHVETISVLNLDSRFDMSDVRDIVRAYRLLAVRGKPGTYNVGSGICRHSGEIFELLRSVAGCQKSTVETAPGVRCQPVADVGRLKRDTGWQPEIDLQTTLRDALAYWKTVVNGAQ